MARTGIITTASGLLFHAGLDSKLRAYDAETGRVLWTGDLPGWLARHSGDVRGELASSTCW